MGFGVSPGHNRQQVVILASDAGMQHYPWLSIKTTKKITYTYTHRETGIRADSNKNGLSVS